MVLHELNIEGIDHTVYIKTSSKKAYRGLCVALLSGMSDADQTRITNINRNNRRIIFFTDMIDCFQAVGTVSSPEMNSCICGKEHIVDKYLIKNVSTREEHIIGSTCARNWFKEDKDTNGCMYCNRINKNGGDCINCSGKKKIKSVVFKWKNKVMEKKEMVSFGKFKDVLTYSQLCSDIRNKDYIDWCLNASKMNEDVKKRLRYFADKHREILQ